jgi:hypothetical protein
MLLSREYKQMQKKDDKENNMNNKKVVIALLALSALMLGVLAVRTFCRKPGAIVLLNGTSAVGKTSIVRELQKIYGDSYIALLGDEFLDTYSVTYPKPESMSDDAYQVQILSALCTRAKQLSLEGKNVFIELVQFDENYDHYCSILECEKVVKILVYCPLDIVVDRLAERNKTTDRTVELLTPLQLFTAIYKLQEFDSELIVDRIQTTRMKYALQAAAQEINMLMQEAGVQASFEQDPFYKDFIKRFRLDDNKEVTLVPIRHWNLVVNSGTHTPEENAQWIAEYLNARA